LSLSRHITGVEVQLHSFLISALDKGVWSTLRPGRFTPEKSPGTHRTVGWVDPRAGLEVSGHKTHTNKLWTKHDVSVTGSVPVCKLK